MLMFWFETFKYILTDSLRHFFFSGSSLSTEMRSLSRGLSSPADHTGRTKPVLCENVETTGQHYAKAQQWKLAVEVRTTDDLFTVHMYNNNIFTKRFLVIGSE